MSNGPARRWLLAAWRLHEKAADTVAEHLAALGFHQHACSSLGRGQMELTCYGADGVLPSAVLAACDAVGESLGQRELSETELLAGCFSDEPCELAPGVWVDPGGAVRPPAGVTVVSLPPAPAFGDGRHPTTRLATRLLLGLSLDGARVLDVGCGTGVLGFVAAQRGAAVVDFTDLDHDAVAAVAASAAANGCDPARVHAGDLLAAAPVGSTYDVILANLYGELQELLLADPRLVELLPRGWLVLSGISQSKRDTVVNALSASGLHLIAEEREAWWHGLLARR